MPDDIIAKDMTADENIKRPHRGRERKPPRKITEKYLYNAGLAYLQRFPTSTANFRRVMLRKIDKSCNAHPEQEPAACAMLLDSVQATFQRMGLLDDEQYLTGIVTSLRRRGLSASAITVKLAAKGLTRDVVADALSQNANDAMHDPEFAAAFKFARRKRIGPFRRIDTTAPEKELAAMGRAGFSFDIAQQILRLSAEEAEELRNSLD